MVNDDKIEDLEGMRESDSSQKRTLSTETQLEDLYSSSDTESDYTAVVIKQYKTFTC